MNRTIKEATGQRFFYDTHEQLKAHLSDFIAAYNFARRLKTLRGLTPYESICKLWTQEPNRFTLDPIHDRPISIVVNSRHSSAACASAIRGTFTTDEAVVVSPAISSSFTPAGKS